MKIEKVEKVFPDLHENICYSHKKFKASFKPWASLKQVHRVIKFNQ